jgi:hypothetical protein
MDNFGVLGDLIAALREDTDLSAWLVSPSGAVIDNTELTCGPAGAQLSGRPAGLLGRRKLFVADSAGFFNFDREPDFLVLPAGQRGDVLLEAARAYMEAVAQCDEAQGDLLAAEDATLTAERRDAGPATQKVLRDRAEAASDDYMEARELESSARAAFRRAFERLALDLAEPEESGE